MRNRARRSLVLSAAGAAVAAAFLAPVGAAHADPTEVVSRADIAYDLLGSLAAKGRIAGYTQADFVRGDRLYTREEIARILAASPAFRGRPNPHDSDAATIRALRLEFGLELHAPRDPAPGSATRLQIQPAIKADTPSLTGWIRARGETNPSAFDLVGRASSVVPVGRDAYLGVTVGKWRDEWYDTHALTGGGHYGPFDNAFLRVDGRALNFTVGIQPMRRWGPGYSGALTLGDDGPSIPQIGIDKSFLLPGSFGRHVGRLNFEEFAGEWWEPNDPTAPLEARGDERFIIARRLTARGGPWDFSVSESMKTTDLPDPEYAFLYPALWLYHNDWSLDRKHHYFPWFQSRLKQGTYWKNYLGDVQVAYHVNDRHNGTQIYADLAIDDLKTPTVVSNGYNTPQKLGEQVGVFLPHVGGETSRYAARVEYTSIDPGMYTNLSLPVTYTENGAPLGYPSGPDARALFARFDARATDKISVGVEGLTRRRKGAPIDGYPDPMPLDRAAVYASYTLRRNASVGLRIEHGRGDTPSSQWSAGDYHNRAELNATLGF